MAAGHVMLPESLEYVSIADPRETTLDHATNTIENQIQTGITILILKTEFLTIRFLRAYCLRSAYQSK